MRGSIFDHIGNLDTLLAVVVGACLATGGALVAEIIQDRLSQKRRQRSAARFFGEIISSLDQIFDLARSSQDIGDPWGPYTLNLYRVVAQEAETYFRNRERLFDIGDMNLRFAIHGHILRFSAPIGSIVRESEAIVQLTARLEEGSLSETANEALKARLEHLQSFREGGLQGALRERAASKALLEQLEALAGARLDGRYN